MKKKAEKIYLGLNVGTNSIGYAVTDEQYRLLKFNGNDAWGSIVFDAASSTKTEETTVWYEGTWIEDSKG